MLKFILNSPALLTNRTLVIADLHLGIEHDIAKSGITIPSQVNKIKKGIYELLLKTRAKKLIILGDIKHKVPGLSWQELEEIPKFLKELSKRVKIIIIRGNHDSFIERLAPKSVDVISSAGLRINNIGLAHGHAWPKSELLGREYLILAHCHPAIEFFSSGFRSIEPVWLRCPINKGAFERRYKRKCKLKQAIVMPVFNPLIGGMAFNKPGFKPIGPLKAVIKWESGKVYLLDGTFLGKLKNLIKK